MEYQEFWRRYREAKEQSLKIAASMILESLPDIHMPFISFPMQQPSTDLAYDERVFERDDFHRRNGHGHPHEEQEVVDFFWRDGYVPRWIDVSVFSANGTITVFEFHSSDVFTKYEADGCPFYTERRLKPWSSKSPILPLKWESVEKSERFSVNWHLKQNRAA